jgi:hypothetical protein
MNVDLRSLAHRLRGHSADQRADHGESARADIAAAARCLESLADGWFPIVCAPRDGTRIRVRRHMGESFGWVTGTSVYHAALGGGWLSRGDGVFGELGLAHPEEWQPLSPGSGDMAPRDEAQGAWL